MMAIRARGPARNVPRPAHRGFFAGGDRRVWGLCRTIADYGNRILVERLMTTSKNMERWTAINANAIEEICEGNNVAQIELAEKATRPDSQAVFSDDSVEIFIDANFDKRTYHQFAFTTAGIKAEGQYYNFSIYNEPWECRVHKGADSWTAEAAIPWDSIKARARPGQTWGINVYRSTQTWRVPP
jgi:hypothetical protein